MVKTPFKLLLAIFWSGLVWVENVDILGSHTFINFSKKILIGVIWNIATMWMSESANGDMHILL